MLEQEVKTMQKEIAVFECAVKLESFARNDFFRFTNSKPGSMEENKAWFRLQVIQGKVNKLMKNSFGF